MNTENNSLSYLSILQKINHKPLIIEYIFSFLKNEPYKFFNIIEKDKKLKELLNSLFSNIKRKNILSKEINENIYQIIILKRFQNSLVTNKSNIFKNETFEETGVKNVIDPSFLVYKSEHYFNSYKEKLPISISSLNDIAFHEQEKNEKIKLVYLPYLKDKFIDGKYLYKNLKLNNKNENGNSNKEIEVLFCIIDDNEYYNYNLIEFKKEIIINEVYFIYIKGDKNINLYDAIEKYLNLLNKNIINKITLGSGFFQEYEILDIPILEMIDYAFINKKKFSVQSSTIINFNFSKDYVNYIKQKIYFGIYILFENGKIDGSIVLDYKAYKNNNNNDINSFKAKEEIKGKFLVIKIYDSNNLSDEKFMKICNVLINCDIDLVICFISQTRKEIKNSICKKVKLQFDFKANKEFLLYSEIPRKISYEMNKETIYDYYYYEVLDCQNDLILYIQNTEKIREIPLFNYYFCQLEKYEKFCFKRYEYWDDTGYCCNKFYFIKKKNTYKTYDIIICTNKKEEEIDINQFFKWKVTDVKIENITYKDLSFDWKNISKQSKNKKGKKGHKMNEKQIIDDELENEEFINDSEEDN